MSEKRRDSKNRVLRTGESQRKDGRYAYKYVDIFHKPHFVYSWKLVPTDRIPAGKRNDISLREKEKLIQADRDDGIDIVGRNMTVCQLYTKQVRYHGNVKLNTKLGRKRLMELLEQDELGCRRIGNVKMSDAKEWALRMEERGFSYNTINNYKRSLKAAFYMAIQDNCLRKNPFDFKLNDVLCNDTKPKKPLTSAQVKGLLSFAQSDAVYSKHYDAIVVLLGTGLRISELCGLTVKDVDFNERLVTVDHQLLRNTAIGYYVETPKTDNGIRKIPMDESVYLALQHAASKNGKANSETIDGYSNFLFLSRNGQLMTSSGYCSIFRSLVRKYNKLHDSNPLPEKTTPHTLRHTFCTRLANAGMNPKALQYIMGHGNITMTLNYYAHATFDSAKEEMERLTCQLKAF